LVGSKSAYCILVEHIDFPWTVVSMT